MRRRIISKAKRTESEENLQSKYKILRRDAADYYGICHTNTPNDSMNLLYVSNCGLDWWMMYMYTHVFTE